MQVQHLVTGRSLAPGIPRGPRRRLARSAGWLAAAGIGLLAAAAALAQGPTPAAPEKTAAAPARAPAAANAARTAPREIKWEDLVPPDWDPMRSFQGMSLNILSDADPRAMALLKKMREVWDNAPVNNRMHEQSVRLPGFVVPLEESKAGMTEFLLVPYYGACIHTPPPPANQIIHVVPGAAIKGLKSMDTVWVSGTLRTLRTDSYMGVSGYRMDSVTVEPYVEPKR